MNSLILVGIRPQFIHLYGLLLEKALPEDITIVNTGQHRSHFMSDIFMEELELPEMVNLEMTSTEDGTYKLAKFIKENKVSDVYVIGDSTTTTIGAIAAKAMGVHLTHIEAGLRCSEFIPEEVNRRFVDSIADELWAPTDYAVVNLLREAVRIDRFKKTENFRVCAFREIAKKVEAKPDVDVVCEFHRQDNVDNAERFERIKGILEMSKRTILWSIHPRITAKYGFPGTPNIITWWGNLKATPPLGYSEWLSYMKGAETVITDSGGIQLEAYELGKEIITLRSDVEWKHTLDRCTLVGDDLSKLARALS